jgi:hypothetical protein
LKIPNGGNQNPYIKEEQTTQWQKEEFEDTKGRQSESHRCPLPILAILLIFLLRFVFGNILLSYLT